jgi:hypothetical protein
MDECMGLYICIYKWFSVWNSHDICMHSSPCELVLMTDSLYAPA